VFRVCAFNRLLQRSAGTGGIVIGLQAELMKNQLMITMSASTDD
jgi:hypothetical protein